MTIVHPGFSMYFDIAVLVFPWQSLNGIFNFMHFNGQILGFNI